MGTIIHLAINGKYAGHIVISDIVKPHLKEAIAALKRAGIEKTVMLKGDAVRSFTLLFLQMWNVTEKNIEGYSRYLNIAIPQR